MAQQQILDNRFDVGDDIALYATMMQPIRGSRDMERVNGALRAVIVHSATLRQPHPVAQNHPHYVAANDFLLLKEYNEQLTTQNTMHNRK